MGESRLQSGALLRIYERALVTWTFTDHTHDGRQEFLGSARSWQSLSEMAEENAFSRIPLGVHIRMDCTEGLRLGYEISDAVNQLSLKKLPQ